MTFTPPVHLPSFGRIHGRKLRANRSALLETVLPRLLIALPESELSAASLFPDAKAPLWFEIGFGAGEHLLGQARRNPGVNFIGCEPYVNGMVRLLAAIDKEKITNIRLFDGDARLVLEKLPDNAIERLFVLFPDPWPKARHHKRRIVSQPTLELFYRKLMPGGLLRLATDHVDYGTWMLEQLVAFKKFTWTAKTSADWKTPPSDWIKRVIRKKPRRRAEMACFWTGLSRKSTCIFVPATL